MREDSTIWYDGILRHVVIIKSAGIQAWSRQVVDPRFVPATAPSYGTGKLQRIWNLLRGVTCNVTLYLGNYAGGPLLLAC